MAIILDLYSRDGSSNLSISFPLKGYKTNKTKVKEYLMKYKVSVTLSEDKILELNTDLELNSVKSLNNLASNLSKQLGKRVTINEWVKVEEPASSGLKEEETPVEGKEEEDAD